MSPASQEQANARPKLLVLIGPTAVGKTRMSLDIAKAWNAEIISGDSIQVYAGMDIGTAKIKPEEREGIPHHLIDICDPTHPFSVAEFQERCAALIPDILSRGKLPFIVGGTGLYVESVAYGYDFAEVGSDDAFREEMSRFALDNGADALHDKLRAVDPEAAERLHPNDQRRVIRAMEVFHLTGTTFTEQQQGQKKTSPYELCMVGLTMDRAVLYARINERVEAMIAEGLIEEVQGLLDRGVPADAVSMHGLGYKEIVLYLQGHLTLEEAVELLKRDTRRFAKRQLSWFRHMPDIHWIDACENFNENLQAIHAIIAGKFRLELEYTFNQPFDDGGNAQ
ncbi:tRNA (adenosine(37)-N6)-dimethylallyltransferase MiaA [Paenibacillus sacheonensis]|uniref:tRNA dimethylallyltransferase n=1 Tax=Paenibacillus sacheonensis TaxID=742054 RepID=A0A7X5BV55_9BACL|nr:tRNA (adenosine(37)-N6)-dimethylallyltransferase MiaA [Paenibacillus sacheonensis]MBM7563387.1 tRNA dimethylallyltransferase [Paenibacillus sacheonensis]NBC68058.1 tRNA (adenosine(37)-N6)-dimethylallyltransferase MiaA [Paenibacillus sacheonensis]